MRFYTKTRIPPCLYESQDHGLEVGEHFGYNWVVGHSGLGIRAGYIRIPPDHPWRRMNLSYIPAEVHGGLIYDGCYPTSALHRWIDFDCGYYGDAADPALCDSAGLRSGIERMMATGIMRDQNYVVMECRRLCEQAAMAALKEA